MKKLLEITLPQGLPGSSKFAMLLFEGADEMINGFDPEQALARWIALDEEKWSRFSACKATLAQREITSQKKLHLLKVGMTEINESQKAERTLLLKQLRAAGLWLQGTQTSEGKIWNLVPMPSEIEALCRDRDEMSLEEEK